jgi:hypothetical protein
MIIHEIYSENRLENRDGSHLIPMNTQHWNAPRKLMMELIFCIEPIGFLTLKPKSSFMVDFDMIFITLLYGLEGLDLNREAVCMCNTFQAIFVLCVTCVLTMMVVCGDISMHDYC